MKLASPRAELAVLRGICHREKKIAGTLLSQIDETYFRFPESREIYTAVRDHMAETGSTPNYRLLIDDPRLSEGARQYFRDSTATITSVDEAHKAADILNQYRQVRGLFNLAANINERMQASKVDIDALLEETATSLNITRSRKSAEDSFLHFGRNNNANSLIKSILFDDNSDSIIPTGIPEFDDVSGGFARGALVAMGAPSSCGKSLVAGQVAINMARMGYKVLFVPLEMSKREMTARIMANVTKTDLTKINLQKIATGDRELMYKRMLRWEKAIKEKGGRLTIFKPNEDMTIEEIFAATAAYDCDVKIVDYVSLLKGTDGEDMWRRLSAVARYAKINAEVENCVNILLVQVDEEGKVRYSRGIAEHASAAWLWYNKKEVIETGIMQVEQPKSRNSMPFPFRLKQVKAFMRVESAPQSDALGPVEASNKPVPNLAAE